MSSRRLHFECMLLAGRRITMTTRDFRSARFSRRQAIGLLGLGAGLGFVEALRGDAQTQTIPRGAIIRTILKDLPPDGVGTGAALMHEHLTAGGNVDVLVDELRASGQQGLSCIVDAATGRREEAALERLGPSRPGPACTSSWPADTSRISTIC